MSGPHHPRHDADDCHRDDRRRYRDPQQQRVQSHVPVGRRGTGAAEQTRQTARRRPRSRHRRRRLADPVCRLHCTYTHHNTDALANLRWLRIAERVEFKTAVLVCTRYYMDKHRTVLDRLYSCRRSTWPTCTPFYWFRPSARAICETVYNRQPGYNFAAVSFYIMKLCSRLFVLYCRKCPKDDKFRYFVPILRKLVG